MLLAPIRFYLADPIGELKIIILFCCIIWGVKNSGEAWQGDSFIWHGIDGSYLLVCNRWRNSSSAPEVASVIFLMHWQGCPTLDLSVYRWPLHYGRASMVALDFLCDDSELQELPRWQKPQDILWLWVRSHNVTSIKTVITVKTVIKLSMFKGQAVECTFRWRGVEEHVGMA